MKTELDALQARNESQHSELVELRETAQTLRNRLFAIDKLTRQVRCMSLEAEQQFARCKDAEQYRISLNGLILKIRDVACDGCFGASAQPARAATTPESDGGK